MPKVNEETTDEELVVLTLQDSQYLQYLIQRYEKKLFYYLKRLLSIDDHSCEDLLQEIFIKTYQNLNNFDTSLKFSSWIYRISRNEAIDYYRKYRNQKEGSLHDEDGKDLTDYIPDSCDLHAEFTKKEISKAVSETLSLLPLKYKDVLVLYYLEDKSYDEISDILQKPAGTIATLLNRAKQSYKHIATEHQLHTFLDTVKQPL